MADPKQLLYTQKQAAVRLGIAFRTVGTLISNLQLKTTMVGGRRLIPDHELERYIESNRPILPAPVLVAAECGPVAGNPNACPGLEDSTRPGAASAEATVSMESEFLSLTQLGIRWRCPPDDARKLLSAENLQGVDTTLPDGRHRTIVAKAVIYEFESRRSEVFRSPCNVQVIEDPAQSRKSKTYFTKKSEDLPTRLLLPKKEAAILLGVSVRTVSTMIARGILHSTRIGGRVLVSMVELQRFARSDHPNIGTRGPYRRKHQE